MVSQFFQLDRLVVEGQKTVGKSNASAGFTELTGCRGSRLEIKEI